MLKAKVRKPKVRNDYFPSYLTIIVPIPVVLAVVKKESNIITTILFYKPNKLQSVFEFRLS